MNNIAILIFIISEMIKNNNLAKNIKAAYAAFIIIISSRLKLYYIHLADNAVPEISFVNVF
jgi:hypothetical protein